MRASRSACRWRRPRRWRWWGVAALVLTMALSGCAAEEQPSSDGTGLAGSLNLEGSSTVAPYTRRAIEAFEAQHTGVSVTTGEIGSGGGIASFINREVPIAASSRPIQPDEMAQAAAQGIEVYETIICWDALAIVVHPSNPVPQLTVEDVARIFAGEVRDWAEVGGNPGRITLYTRNEESGTFSYMEGELIQRLLGADAEYDSDINKLASAPGALTAVAGDPSAISYAGLSNMVSIPAGLVRAVPIALDASSAAVEADETGVRDGDYPIARGLYYYTDGDPARSEDPLVAAWIAFVVSPQGQEIARELHLVPAH